jgi:2,3-bisphosphoglycerate-dependent phosphoglycerate mutase
MHLILLRHGQSTWNLENKFTGWKDVPLTKLGIEEAEFSGRTILENQFNIQSIYTSLLKRATETADIITDIISFPKEEVRYEWRLNERHYGALQGLNKSETAAKYGENQVQIWRRSYDTPPPLLDYYDNRHPRFNDKFNKIFAELPIGESLKNVVDRLDPFWKEYTMHLRESSGDHLIVAHSNSLRAIVKLLDKLSNEEICSVNIPTGVPLVYELDRNLKVISKEYLMNYEQLKAKQEEVMKQGKIKSN